MGLQALNTAFEWRSAPTADYAVIGDPIAHSLSPKMHNAAYRVLGKDLTYVGIRVPENEVHQALDYLADLGYKGINVTLPLKERVIGWLKECDEFASRVAAVNTISCKDRYGFNTDAPGFLETLRLANVPPGTPTLLLGAGGASRAIAAILSDESYPLRIWNRTRKRAVDMVEDLEIDAGICDTPDLSGAGLIVNTTSASLSGEPLQLDWNSAIPGVTVMDIAYGYENGFLTEPQTLGLRCFDGKAMLVMQGALALEFWLGVEAPHQAMWEALS